MTNSSLLMTWFGRNRRKNHPIIWNLVYTLTALTRPYSPTQSKPDVHKTNIITYRTSNLPVNAAALLNMLVTCRFRLLFCVVELYDIGLNESSSFFSISTLADPGPSSLILFSREIRKSSNFWLDSEKLACAWNIYWLIDLTSIRALIVKNISNVSSMVLYLYF